MSGAMQIYPDGFVRLMYRSREGLVPTYLALSIVTCVIQGIEGTYMDCIGSETKGPYLNLSEEECETLMAEVMRTRQREASW